VKPIAATRIYDELPPMGDILGRKVTVLGSTGSIGVNTLDVIRHVRRLHGENALPVAALYQPLRAALTGDTHGPELAPLVDLMGADRVVARLRAAGEL